MAARSMKQMATASTVALSKWPMLASWVEKPPVETVERLCARASKGPIPAIQ